MTTSSRQTIRDAVFVAGAFALGLAAVLASEPMDSLRGTLAPVALVVLASLGAGLLGDAFARALGVEANAAERLIAGFFLLSLWTVATGSFGHLEPAVLALPLLVVPVLGARGLVPLLRRDAGEVVEEFRLAGAWFLGFPLVVLLAVAWGFLSTLMLPVGLDAPSYHLGLPVQYLLHGSLRPPDTMGYYLYWQQFEVLVLPLMAFDPSGIAANLLGFVLYLALIGIAGSLGGERGSPGRWMAAVAVATSPLVLLLLSYTKNDLFAVAAVCAGVRPLARLAPGQGARDETGARDGSGSGAVDPGAATWSGFFLGGALAIKPSAAFAVLPIVAWVMITRRVSARSLFRLFLGLALLPAYWAVRNLVWTGTSILPPNVKGMATPPAHVLSDLLARSHHLLQAFLEFLPEYIDGPMGVLLLVLGAAFLLRRSPVAGFRGVLVAGLLFWLILGNTQARFLLPLVVLAAALGARGLGVPGRAVRWAVLILGALSLITTVRLHASYSPFFLVHAGSLDRDAFVTHWVNTYPVQAEASRGLADTAVIASVGESHLMYLARRAAWDVYWERPRLLDLAHGLHDPAGLARGLRDAGFTHVLYNPEEHDPGVSRGGEPLPLCARDTATLLALLGDSRLSTPFIVDPRRPGQGLFALRGFETVVGRGDGGL